MSRLEELIQQLCPNGVEYRPFGDMATIVRGASPRPIKNFITTREDGVNWIKIGDVKPGSKYITDTAEKITPEGAKKTRLVKKGDFILSNSMSFGRPYIMKVEGCIHDGWLAISNFDSYFIADFLYHLLNSKQYQYMMKQKASFGGAVQNLNADIIRELMMPVVPMEVQQEIVRILDQFTDLTAELTAELTARKKQYAYYLDKLLTFEKGIKTLPLQDCCILSRGDYITKKDAAPGNIPVILGGQEPAYYIDRYNHTGKAIVISRSGASAGFVSYWDEPIFVTDGFIVEGTTSICTRFLYYFLKNKQAILNGMKKGGGVPHITGKNIGEMKIPIIPMYTQERIVSILDRFDALCNDLTSGLPAEIEARRKQYEYYRDKLLTFKEL